MPETNDYDVLIVDPDKTMATTMRAILNEEGYKVTIVRDGEEAYQACQRKIPKFLVLEGLIPKLNGLDLAKAVRALPSGDQSKILLVSAVYASAKFQSQITEAGINETLAKPFRPDQLVEKIRTLESIAPLQPVTTVSGSLGEPFQKSGEISQVPFIRLGFHLFSRKETGTLRLEHGSTKKLVTFKKGGPEFVVSNLERECLSNLLLQKGRLTHDECERSLKRMVEMKKRHGEILIQMGLIEPFELEEALKQQARQKFTEIFTWREGRYIFIPDKTFKKDLTPVDLGLSQLILRGIKEHYSLAELQTELGSLSNAVPKINEDAVFKLDDFKLATWDTRIVREIKFGKSLSRILKMRLAAREIDVYHLFFAFYMLDVIQFDVATVPVRAPGPKPKVPVPPTPPKPTLSPFELIEVSPKASDDDVRKAFEKKLEKLESKEAPHSEIRELRAAFSTIASVQGRRDYLVRVYEEAGELPVQARDSFKPKEFVELGKRFLELKKFELARKVFSDAVGLFKDSGILFTYLGFSIVRASMAGEKVNQKDQDRARKAMIKGAQLAEDDPETHFLLGKVFSLDMDYEKASREFRKVLSIDSKHQQASSELRVVQMRMEKEKNTSFIRWKR